MRDTSEDFDDGMTDKDMYQGIKEQMTDDGRYYLLLDEVQEIDDWEKAVNSLLENANTDIYVTGSNSKLMSSELSTYLTGRYISIPVYMLSFGEYLDFKKSDSRSPKELLIVENIGKTFSANAIAKFLKSEGRSLSVEAVYNYLNWLENIVYFELRRRGYEVYIGKHETKEIDFMAVQRDERIYVQVCRSLPEESDREITNLLEIKDHYLKYVVTLDELAAGNINGVKIVYLADFVLSDKY